MPLFALRTMSSLPPNFDPKRHTLGLLAGAGDLPRLVLQGARAAGVRVVCAGFRGAVGDDLLPHCDAFRRFRVGAVEAPAAFFRAHGVTHIMLEGQIRPSCIYTLWPDSTARRILSSLDRRNAHTIFGAVCRYAKEQGWQTLPSVSFLGDHISGVGLLAGPELSSSLMAQAEKGMLLARGVADLDIGQSLILNSDCVLCVEGFKGTNECLQHADASSDNPAMLCKVTKKGHDMRFDVPCIGPATIRHCIRAFVKQVVIEADRTILLRREEVVRLCEEAGISLLAMRVPEVETSSHTSIFSTPVADDATHAVALARALDSLGIGSSAVVCEGVVIAVEDAAGLTKCLRRAREYMKRIRFLRLVNWLCRLFLGRRSSPPSPMVLASARPLSPGETRLASRYGIRVVAQGEHVCK